MPTNKPMEDQQLVREVINGNRKAYLDFIEKYKLLVVHMVGRIVTNDLDKEELCQDIFVKLYESLGSFKGNSKLSTWVATVSYRMAVNFARKKSKRKETEELDDVAFKVGHLDDYFEDQDFNRFIRGLIDQMPEPYRVVITLFYLDGFSYPEIIDITGMPEGTVKNYLFRARKKLKALAEPFIGTEIEI